MALCFFCHKPLELEGKVSFRELCAHCGMDVHVCLNCEFYDPGYSNDCREPQAEPVRDREARNTCEYFVLTSSDREHDDAAARVKAQLDDLFKRK
ncbi:MAG: hypothetical protein JRI95_06240 [Deltaproteobacteria bacterium]|nr:hypothetical protein [Deltaproteobacteria bacterium]MBW2087276.1 hypothetical protein [Deltaproteobacteria bacterium]